MTKVRLGDVAEERKETCKQNVDGYPIVGLEHLIPEDINLTEWSEGVENTFSKLFREGDVLFGRRRAYLKKAAVAPFDGICSGDITVIKPIKGKIRPELLPFVIQNDNFFDFAVGKSAGSLSPRVKWEHLRNYEFELPGLDKQRELAQVLWAMDATKRSYQKLLQKTDELVKSQFIEMFGEKAVKHHGWKVSPVDKLVEKPVSGEWGKDDPDGTGIKVLRTTNFTDQGVIDYSDVVTRKIDDKKVYQKYMKSGDVLIEKSGGSDTKPVGRVVFYDGKDNMFLFNNFTSVLRLKPEVGLLPEYLFKFLFVNYWSDGTRIYENKTTGIHNLKLTDYLSGTNIPLPPMELQEQFSAFMKQSDKSKFEIEQSLTELTALYKRIVFENLG